MTADFDGSAIGIKEKREFLQSTFSGLILLHLRFSRDLKAPTESQFATFADALTPFASAMPGYILLLDIMLALLGLLIFYSLFLKKSALSLPPGPPGLPLVGNILDMPMEMEWLTFSRWGEQYGRSRCLFVLTRYYVRVNDLL
jgi:hypothetical protein